MQASRDAELAMPGWPLRPEDSLIVTDLRVETILAWSEDVGGTGLRLEDVLDDSALHMLRGTAGLNEVTERSVIAGDISTAFGPRRVLLRRRADTILLHMRPPTPPEQHLADPMIALSILLRSLRGASPGSLAATACANLRALLGASEIGLMRVAPGGARSLHAIGMLDPSRLPEPTCVNLLRMREADNVVHLADPDRSCRTLLGPIAHHLPAPVLHDPALPEPALLIFGPMTEEGAICFFCGKFARAPLSFELAVTLDMFALLFAMVSDRQSGGETI